ncbi:MAG TPA: cytochrome c [Tianweitania sediminis]|jgi:mono/diheme cytochrome c family protein|nr:cytochrome c [Tianweitania sediminis]
MRPWSVALLAGVLLSGCNEMGRQPRYDSSEPSRLFADGKSLQSAPEGTVAQDAPARLAALTTRPPMSAALLQRGRERYAINCVPCHDLAGDGHGTVPARGFPQPPSFHEPRLVAANSAYFVDVITYGHGVMYSYAARVEPADRWAIAAYVRALQLARRAPADALSNADRQALGGGNGS